MCLLNDIRCNGCSFDHPLDRLACAVIKRAILDTKINRVQDKSINDYRDRLQAELREAALSWLRNEGADWMRMLNIRPEPILRRVKNG